MPRISTALAAIYSVAAFAAPGPVPAQQYPGKPIRIVVPFPAGGTSDILARAIGQKLAEEWKQQVIVDPRPGAGANIGAEIVAKALPDGYTLLLASTIHAINPSLYPKLTYDPLRDFTPLTLIAATSQVLAVHPSVPVSTVKELIGYAKKQPGALSYSSAGNGSQPHLTGELFKTMTGVDMLHVPYKGAGPSLAALVAGEIQVMFATSTLGLPHIQSGKLRPLAYDGPKRAPFLPDIPTLAEAGGPPTGVNVTWHGLFAPAATPALLRTRIESEILKAVHLPEVRERIANLELYPVGSTSKEFTPFVAEAAKRFAEMVRLAGVQAE